ncbi:unnamed protein product [Periconia digitata]|uniref:Uncharacterized protein n=1 Tax=Periconia digitata TaxID=1303443 RepID=A0A9W4UEE5_9PLEO|nr:unnamed protein product [Periconia digitata]
MRYAFLLGNSLSRHYCIRRQMCAHDSLFCELLFDALSVERCRINQKNPPSSSSGSSCSSSFSSSFASMSKPISLRLSLQFLNSVISGAWPLRLRFSTSICPRGVSTTGTLLIVAVDFTDSVDALLSSNLTTSGFSINVDDDSLDAVDSASPRGFVRSSLSRADNAVSNFPRAFLSRRFVTGRSFILVGDISFNSTGAFPFRALSKSESSPKMGGDSLNSTGAFPSRALRKAKSSPKVGDDFLNSTRAFLFWRVVTSSGFSVGVSVANRDSTEAFSSEPSSTGLCKG